MHSVTRPGISFYASITGILILKLCTARLGGVERNERTKKVGRQSYAENKVKRNAGTSDGEKRTAHLQRARGFFVRAEKRVH